MAGCCQELELKTGGEKLLSCVFSRLRARLSATLPGLFFFFLHFYYYYSSHMRTRNKLCDDLNDYGK